MNISSLGMFVSAILFFLIALYTWFKGDDVDTVEVRRIGGTTYYEPWVFKLGSVLALACGIIFIIIGILRW